MIARFHTTRLRSCSKATDCSGDISVPPPPLLRNAVYDVYKDRDWLAGGRFAELPAAEGADVIVVLEAPVPWIPRVMQPSANAKVIHIAHDPLFLTHPMRGFPTDLAVAGDFMISGGDG